MEPGVGRAGQCRDDARRRDGAHRVKPVVGHVQRAGGIHGKAVGLVEARRRAITAHRDAARGVAIDAPDERVF